MGEADRLRDSRVAILGLGLIGGSLAMALRNHCKELVAVDPDPGTIELALKQGIVARISSDPGEIVPQADVIVLAAPVGAILDLLDALPDLHPGSPVVIDLGSTKRQICKKLDGLPERFAAVGGHPMCGREFASLVYADPAIFVGATFALVPVARTTEDARTLAEQIALTIGSKPVWMDADRHDELVAATSHLPYLLANALSLAVPEEGAALVGSGFRSTARLASSYTPMMLDVLASNRDYIHAAAHRIRSQLDLLEGALRRGAFDELEERLKQSASHYSTLVDAEIEGEA
jgi:prephenate dehydrogenase